MNFSEGGFKRCSNLFLMSSKWNVSYKNGVRHILLDIADSITLVFLSAKSTLICNSWKSVLFSAKLSIADLIYKLLNTDFSSKRT